MDWWILYDKDLCHERVTEFRGRCIYKVSQNAFVEMDFDVVHTKIFQKK